MSKNKKLVMGLIGCVLGIAIIYTVFWYTTAYKRYLDYEKNFPEILNSGVKILTDDDGYKYGVAKPGFTSFSANLSINSGDVYKDEEARYSLLIWPAVFGEEYELGIRINNSEDSAEVYIDNARKATDADDQILVDKYSEEITRLVNKANEVWNLGIE